MTKRRFQVASDCAILPGPEGYILFQGTTGRNYRLQVHVGRWLVLGAPEDARFVLSNREQSELLDLGVLMPNKGTRSFTLNDIAPVGRNGWYLLLILLVLGTVAWAVALSHRALFTTLFPNVLGSWVTWAVLPLVGLVGTLLHEWGHVLALRVIGGRAGRVRFRFSWPWAVTEVGPFERALTPLQCMLLVSGGVLVELVILGVSMTLLILAPSNPVVGTVVITTGVYLMFNVVPTPWSDGGKALGIAFGQIRVLVGGRQDHD